jgi:hypothetical protein
LQASRTRDPERQAQIAEDLNEERLIAIPRLEWIEEQTDTALERANELRDQGQFEAALDIWQDLADNILSAAYERPAEEPKPTKKSMERRRTRPPAQQSPATPTVVFADDHTRLSHEIRTAVAQFNSDHPRAAPQPGRKTVLEPVRFDAAESERGETALFWANDFINAERDPHTLHPDYEHPTDAPSPVYHVEPRTKQLLDALKIPYQTVEPQTATR